MGNNQSRWEARALPDPRMTFESPKNRSISPASSGNKLINKTLEILGKIRNTAPLYAVVAEANFSVPLAVIGSLTVVLDFLKTEVTNNIVQDTQNYVNERVVQSALIEIKSTLDAIQKAIENVVNPIYKPDSRKMEAISAKHSLDRVLSRFENDVDLQNESILASPLLIACCPVFVAIYDYIGEVDPQYNEEKARRQISLVELLKKYCDLCFKQRKTHIEGDKYSRICVGNGTTSFMDRWAELDADVDSIEYNFIRQHNDERREWEHRYHFEDKWEGLSYKNYTSYSYIAKYKDKLKILYETEFNKIIDKLQFG